MENYFSQLPGTKAVTIKGRKLSTFNCCPPISKKFYFVGDEEIAQSVKYLPGKHENLNLILRTHLKSLLRWCVLVITGMQRWKQVDSGGLPESQSRLLSELQVNGENPLQKHQYG